MLKSNTFNKKIFEDFLHDIDKKKLIFHIEACNDFVVPRDWGFHNRVNHNYHIGYIRRGKGSYTYNGLEDQMEKSKLYFFSNGICHSRALNQENIPHMVLLRFNIYDANGSPYQSPEPFGFSTLTDYDVFGTLLDRLVYNHRLSQKAYGIKIGRLILEQLMYEIGDALQVEDEEEVVDYRIKKTITYIHEHIGESISLDTLSHKAGLSTNYYRKLFKKFYKVYPKAYMIQVRVEHAEYLLMETGYPIKEIARRLGYSDAYSFSKQFKEKKGYAPSVYRNYSYQLHDR